MDRSITTQELLKNGPREYEGVTLDIWYSPQLWTNGIICIPIESRVQYLHQKLVVAMQNLAQLYMDSITVI